MTAFMHFAAPVRTSCRALISPSTSTMAALPKTVVADASLAAVGAIRGVEIKINKNKQPTDGEDMFALVRTPTRW